jgi:hypothetical protein
MSLGLKIGLALFFVFGAAIAMTTGLNYLRFDQTLQHLLSQRLTVVLSETRRDIVSGLDLGLRIENMENLEAVLGRRMGMSDGIRNIQVFACDGSLVESQTAAADTDQGNAPPFALPQTDQWQSFQYNRAITGTVLRDSVGQCAGYVRIIADISDAKAELAQVFTRMWQAAVLGMTAIIPVLLVLIVLMRRRHRVFVELNDDLQCALDGQAPRVPAHDGDVLTSGEMRMISLYRQLRDQLPMADTNDSKKRNKRSSVSNEPVRDGEKHDA